MTEGPPSAAASVAALAAVVEAQGKKLDAVQAILDRLAAEVDETIRVTGCMDPRNRERDDWLRQFATVYQSDDAKAERAAQSAMTREWQAAKATKEGTREFWQRVALGLGIVWSALLLLQAIGGYAITAIRAITGGAP